MPSIDLSILNQRQTPAFFASSLATRPSFGFPGRVFIDTDSPSTGLYRDTGTAWVQIADPGAGTTGTLQQVTTNGNTTNQGISITAGALTLGTASGDNQTLLNLPATNTLLYRENAGSLYGFNIAANDNSLFLTNTEGGFYQTLYFGDGSTTNIFGISASNDLGVTWNPVLVVNGDNKVGVNTNAPTADFDVHSAVSTIAQLNQTVATNNSLLAFQNSGTGKWRIGNYYNAAAHDFGIFDTVSSIQRLTIKNTGVSELISNLSITKTGTGTATTNTYGLFSNNSFIIPAGTNFSVSGSTYGSILGFYKATYGGNASYLNSQINAGLVSINQMEFSSTGTITMAQATGVRATGAAIVQNQLTGTVSGTISHLAGLQILGNFKGGTGLLTVTNAYGLLVNNLDDYSSGFTYTNRWGIYQDGASDRNYFAGNTLIGTTTDTGDKLNVNGNINVSANNFFRYNGDTGLVGSATSIGGANTQLGIRASSDILFATNGANERMRITSGGNAQYTGDPFIYSNTTSGGTAIHSGLRLDSTNKSIRFFTNDLGRLDITSGGNVLIGTTTDAGQKLQVNGSALFGLTSTNQILIDNSSVPGILINGGAASNTIGASAFLRIGDNTNQKFWTQQINASNNFAFWFFTTPGWTNVSYIDNTTGAYVPLSDKNKKKNFEDSNLGLDAVLKLKPTLYNMSTQNDKENKQLGFIAQEIKDIIPQAYQESGDFIGLNYNPIIAVLTKAIQQLNDKIENLKN